MRISKNCPILKLKGAFVSLNIIGTPLIAKIQSFDNYKNSMQRTNNRMSLYHYNTRIINKNLDDYTRTGDDCYDANGNRPIVKDTPDRFSERYRLTRKDS